jgi:hypothetical protein
MELNNDRKFPLILAGHNYDDFVDKYNAIVNRLNKLEAEYKINDPKFEISPLWTCYCIHGQVAFNVTEQCCEPGLKARMLEIFNEVL